MGYIADKVVKAERRITSYPFDTEAWSILIRDAQVIFLFLKSLIWNVSSKTEKQNISFSRPKKSSFLRPHSCSDRVVLLQMKKIEDARKIYERLVTQFPNAGRYWKIYIEHEVIV